MGPITPFDKSFLQSLNVDESVWFDHFFLTNVCPLFYVETLADLEKSVREGRTPEEEVGLIADKSPEMHSAPNVNYVDLCIGDLMGNPVPMTGQIPLAGGRLVKAGGRTGVVYDETPEAEAFSRWQKREFLEIERLFAKSWRGALSTLDLGEVANGFWAIGIDSKSCKTLEDAKGVAETVTSAHGNPIDRLKLAFSFLNVPQELHGLILARWSNANYPPLANYAPYAAYVVTVEAFFQVALASRLISSERPSNRVDIAYLFYLPFCMLFVSSDRLHRKCAPLFLRNDQEFVLGGELKDGLRKLNQHYAQLPDSTKEQGVMSFAGGPPLEGEFLVTQLWERHLRKGCESKEVKAPEKTQDNSKLVESLKMIRDAPPLRPEEVDFDPKDPDTLSIERSVRKRKGSWWQLPKGLKVSEGD